MEVGSARPSARQLKFHERDCIEHWQFISHVSRSRICLYRGPNRYSHLRGFIIYFFYTLIASMSYNKSGALKRQCVLKE